MYLYHIKPKEIEGKYLMPFSSLNQELQAKNNEKYTNRQNILDQHIPFLDVYWRDIIHLSPVDLSIIKQYILENFSIDLQFEYYKIPMSSLNKDNAIIYLNNNTIHNSVQSETFEGYAVFQDLEKYKEIPDVTKEYYKSCYEQNTKPLLFYGIPHVFYRGKIDTTNLELMK